VECRTTTEVVERMPDIVTPEGYFNEEETAARLNVKAQTLRVWASRRKGPPRTVVARRPLYRQEALEAWLRAAERDFDDERRRKESKRARA